MRLVLVLHDAREAETGAWWDADRPGEVVARSSSRDSRGQVKLVLRLVKIYRIHRIVKVDLHYNNPGQSKHDEMVLWNY